MSEMITNRITLSLLLLFFCLGQTQAQDNDNRFDTQAHRGGRGLMPENTIVAMLDAMDRGVVTLEMDLLITKDEKVVVAHDPTFNEKFTTTPDGKYLTKEAAKEIRLYNLTYDSIQRYDVGLKSNPDYPRKKNIAAIIPLFSDLLDATEAKGKELGRLPHYNIEIKSTKKWEGINHPKVTKFVYSALNIIEKYKIADRVTIQSFDVRALRIINKKYPQIKTSYLINYKEKRSVEELITRLGFTPSIYSPDYRHVTKQLVDYCHQQGMQIIPWTINDKKSLNKLKKLGIDGVISDYLDIFK